MLIEKTSLQVTRQESSTRPSRRPHRVKWWSSPHHRRRLRVRQRQSMPPAPDAAILPARPTAALGPQLMPLLDLLADLIARGVLAQRRESNTDLGPEGDPTAVTKAEAISPFTREGGTSRSDSQIPTNFSSKVPPQSHLHPHMDDPVTTQEKKL